MNKFNISEINTKYERVKERFNSYILSASGIRAIFALSQDEEDNTRFISDEDKVITITIARAFSTYVKPNGQSILLAQDARPTGSFISLLSLKTLLSLGYDVKYLYISAAPETMAYSHTQDYFYYISASHNPIGHNGFKFGLKGGVFSKEAANEIIAILKEMIDDPNCVEKAKELLLSSPQDKRNKAILNIDKEKALALDYYTKFVLKTAELREDFKSSIGLVADFNGSARSLSIDKTIFMQNSIKFSAFNDTPGDVKHPIVPEGENLIPVKEYLEVVHKNDPSFILGYTPDNDGDRGNFVYINSQGEGEILQAQEVFALVLLIEVASLDKKGVKNIAISVNGPTSERVDQIAKAFNAKVFRAEVGEANVVNLGLKLEEEGYVVKVLGEGSNGGNITRPSAVRDPLNTAFSFIKLFSDEELFNYIQDRLNLSRESLSMDNLLKCIPAYTTTPAFSKDAKMSVKSKDWAGLKQRYEKLLTATIEDELLPKFNQKVTYRVIQTEGIIERFGIGEAFRSKSATGGLKVQFLDSNNESLGYMWFRPSGTEAVLRVLVDLKGKNEALHDEILSYQRSLITRCNS